MVTSNSDKHLKSMETYHKEVYKLLIKYEMCPESKYTSRVRRYGNFYVYYGNTAVDLNPLPVSRARLTVIEPGLFEWDVFEMTAPIQSPAKCKARSVIRFLKAKCERPVEIHKQIVAPSDFHLFLHLKKHLAGKMFDDDYEVQEVMTWFKGQAADFYGSGYRSWFQDLINVWTKPAIMLKNKVMYMQFIHSVSFVN